MRTKLNALENWQEANPCKTEKDYLLEVRCPDDATRKAVLKLLDYLDKSNMEPNLFVERKNFYTSYQANPLNQLESTVFDILILPRPGRNSYAIEVDMPESVLGKQEENKSKTESIPKETYLWLLKKWFPDFDFDSLDDKTLNKLLWEDMPPFINFSFPNWKDGAFISHLIKNNPEILK